MIVPCRTHRALFFALLTLTLLLGACPKNTNDAPDPEESRTEIEKNADNVTGKARKALDEAEAALKQSAEKVDESLEAADASD